MKTYIWNIKNNTIIVCADGLEQAQGYAILKIRTIVEEGDLRIVALKTIMEISPMILEPYKCVIL